MLVGLKVMSKKLSLVDGFNLKHSLRLELTITKTTLMHKSRRKYLDFRGFSVKIHVFTKNATFNKAICMEKASKYLNVWWSQAEKTPNIRLPTDFFHNIKLS